MLASCARVGERSTPCTYHRGMDKQRPLDSRGRPVVVPKRPPIEESLAVVCPELAAQWAVVENGDMTPYDVKAKSGYYAWWYCGDPKCSTPGGTLFQSTVSNRRLGASCCKSCRYRKSGEGQVRVTPDRSITARSPALVSLWDTEKNLPLSTDDFGCDSTREVWWRCDRGPDHAWRAPVGRVFKSVINTKNMERNNGCPFCAGKRLSVTNRLSDVAPEAAKTWHPTKNGGLTTEEIQAGSNTKYWWLCPEDEEHVWHASPYNRTKGGCPFCVDRSNRATSKNNFALVRPDTALEWHPTKNDRTAFDVTPGSGYMAWWKCPVDARHEWQARVAHRFTVDAGCPFCSGKRVSDTNNLRAMRPALADQWHPTKNGSLLPEEVNAFHNGKKWWKCDAADDHEWEATVASRTDQGVGCPFCSGTVPSADYNLAVIEPAIAEQWHPTKNGTLTPYDVTPAADRRVWWRCSENPDHEWRAMVSHRRKSGCPSCAKFGFASTKPGYLYLLEHEMWGLLQIGITNVPEGRIGKHESSGWQRLDVRGPMDGGLTRDLETGILKALRSRGAVFAKDAGHKRFDGWSEAWAVGSYPAVKLSDLIALVYEDDVTEPRRGRGRRGVGTDDRSLPPRT